MNGKLEGTWWKGKYVLKGTETDAEMLLERAKCAIKNGKFVSAISNIEDAISVLNYLSHKEEINKGK